jgi:hypothetical protein
VYLAFSPLELPAQSLRLSSAPASPGKEATVHLSLTSPPAKEPPSTLQWDITIPVQVMELPGENVTSGPQAQAAGKALQCREKSRTAAAQVLNCLMFGGREPIHDGVIAMLRIKIAPHAPVRPARIRIDQAIAVRKDATKIEMKPVETMVRIRR